jgi:arabinofuranosyltransferase
MTYKQETRLVISFLLLVMGLVLVRTAWVCDDAYITFRTIDNFVHGHGPTWNIDERVQSFTHPLWMLLVAAFYFFTREFYYTVTFVSIFLTFAAVILFLSRLARSATSAALAVCILIFSKAFIDYATSGLENPLSYVFAALFFVVYFRYEHCRGRTLALFLIASFMAVNRLDLILLAGC